MSTDKNGKKGGNALGGIVILALLVGLPFVGCASSVWSSSTSGGSSLDVPKPAGDESTGTVELLARAANAQGVCYGWELRDGGSPVSVGSNLGDGVDVREQAACPRWIVVRADVTYTPESSESSDSAYVQVVGSSDLEYDDLDRIRTGLDRFELDQSVFVDDPGWAVCRAAVALPLLAAENGIVDPVPFATATPAGTAATPTALPDAGSDFWRARWSYTILAVVLIVGAAAMITIGVVARRRARESA